MTGVPGVALPEGWDLIPGARGCTPQSCAFRDHFAELKGLGVSQLFGVSVQDTAYQREAAQRLHLPFALLSDEGRHFSQALRLPTLVVAGLTLLKRLALVADAGTIRKVFYPVFPPEERRGGGGLVARRGWRRRVEIGAELLQERREHLRRQDAGVRIVARAMVAVEKGEAAGPRNEPDVGAHARKHGRKACRRARARPNHARCGQVQGERRDWGMAAIVAVRKPRQWVISSGSGLFCGGTQRTALVMAQSTSLSPSS